MTVIYKVPKFLRFQKGKILLVCNQSLFNKISIKWNNLCINLRQIAVKTVNLSNLIRDTKSLCKHITKAFQFKKSN